MVPTQLAPEPGQQQRTQLLLALRNVASRKQSVL